MSAEWKPLDPQNNSFTVSMYGKLNIW